MGHGRGAPRRRSTALKTVRVHPEASAELAAAIDWYGSGAPALGVDLRADVAKAIERLASAPRAWPRVSARLRRILLDRFPYGISYAERDDHILVVAVAHASRRPGYWRKRV